MICPHCLQETDPEQPHFLVMSPGGITQGIAYKFGERVIHMTARQSREIAFEVKAGELCVILEREGIPYAIGTYEPTKDGKYTLRAQAKVEFDPHSLPQENR